ncbi:MAG: DUF4262 domain-containing protein [Anderseniella sp.]
MLGFVSNIYDRWYLNNHRRKTLSKIEKHGWTATYVYDPGDNHIDFAYTIGFSDFGAPELIAFDLPAEIADYVFWEAFDLVKSGKQIHHGFKHIAPDPDSHGFECTFLEATHPDTWSKYIFDAKNHSRERGRGDKPAAMQIVWPSAENRLYPWQPNCPQTVIDAQPPLYAKPPG